MTAPERRLESAARSSSQSQIKNQKSKIVSVLSNVPHTIPSNGSGHKPETRSNAWDGFSDFGTPLGRHLGRLLTQETQCWQALGRRDGVHRGWGGMPFSPLRAGHQIALFLDTILLLLLTPRRFGTLCDGLGRHSPSQSRSFTIRGNPE